MIAYQTAYIEVNTSVNTGLGQSEWGKWLICVRKQLDLSVKCIKLTKSENVIHVEFAVYYDNDNVYIKITGGSWGAVVYYVSSGGINVCFPKVVSIDTTTLKESTYEGIV